VGTFTVNVAGSLILGLLVGGANAVPGAVMDLLGTGFCGALTTYSTFGYETIRLIEERARVAAVATVVGSILAGFGAAFLGISVAGAIWSGTG
jgi:CrcB protein